MFLILPGKSTTSLVKEIHRDRDKSDACRKGGAREEQPPNPDTFTENPKDPGLSKDKHISITIRKVQEKSYAQKTFAIMPGYHIVSVYVGN